MRSNEINPVPSQAQLTTPVKYESCIIQYVHNPLAGEVVNIGVILFSASASFIDIRLESKYAPFTSLFAGFDDEHFRSLLRQLRIGTEQLQSSMQVTTSPERDRPLFLANAGPRSLEAVRLALAPDEGLSIKFSSQTLGLTQNPVATLDSLFDRMVKSQRPVPHAEESRSDEDVWNVFKTPLQRHDVLHELQSKKFSTDTLDFEFDHAFPNGAWNVIQPVTLDLVKKDSIQKKASQWAGIGIALSNHPDLGKIFILLGKPHDQENMSAYNKGKNLINKMPVDHEIIEEDSANDFAKYIAEKIAAHKAAED
jgi:hypothetical protein